MEPGAGTQDAAAESFNRSRSAGSWAAAPPRNRRVVMIAAAMAVALAGAGYLYATRPLPPPPPPTPWPAQAVGVAYGGPVGPHGDPRVFDFSITFETLSGPPVTVVRIDQNSRALTLVASPSPPFTVRAGSSRIVHVSLRVSDCEKVARNAGLPFLDVTLRNTRAMQQQSFILGDRYAQDLARAIETQCPQDQISGLKPPDGPARSQYVDKTKRREFPRSTLHVPLCVKPWHNKSVTALARPLLQPHYRA
ncbi:MULTISPECIES: Tat pathway signal sequence domain protein [unclassified Streptomyces]|uniref:Tat pathway signal sequence domain protein n=1 Tax=unclassified Streptomyces TaxID=2593676 RepID=UPI0033339011